MTVLCCSALNQFSNELQLNIDTDKLTGTMGLFHYRRTKPGSNPWGKRRTHAFSEYIGGAYNGAPLSGSTAASTTAYGRHAGEVTPR